MLIHDDFEDERSPGTVIGTPVTSTSTSNTTGTPRLGIDTPRLGIDTEKTLSIDNGALRISPLITPGWNRSGIAYGPFQRQAGLALSVFMLNCHNASEGNTIEESLKGRFFRWLRGSETDSISHRLMRWATSHHHQHRLWHFYRWLRNHKNRFGQDQHLKENLAVGWFNAPNPDNPTQESSIVVRTAGPENGELCTSVNHHLLPAFKGLQNLQTYYVVVLRKQGAAYYAATLPNAYGFNDDAPTSTDVSTYPSMRLIGIDTHHTADTVYAGIHQAALGQVGFRIDSRVYGVRAEAIAPLANWYGTAHMADTLTRNDQPQTALAHTNTETGETWKVSQGSYHSTPLGTSGTENHNIAIVKTSEPVGAVHAVIKTKNAITDNAIAECALLWRTQDEQNTWALFLTATNCQLKRCEQGQWTIVATDSNVHLSSNTSHAIQILDTGSFFSLYLSGKLLFNQWFTETKFKNECSVGLLSNGALPLWFQHIEAHPRQIPIPPQLQIAPLWQKHGSQIALSERFHGPASHDLEQHMNEQANQAWEKTIGQGKILLTGRQSALVEASSKTPNPKRLAYTLPWQHPHFADVSVDILSPGEKRYEGEKGRGGLIFWQDKENYMIVNHWLDDTFDGSAMSVFLTVEGYEELYDGVWANLGKRISWGKTRQHRVAFDGLSFVVYVDSEPVLYRSIRDVYPKVNPLQINRVGIVANWEWGDDTGSEFSHFSASF